MSLFAVGTQPIKNYIMVGKRETMSIANGLLQGWDVVHFGIDYFTASLTTEVVMGVRQRIEPICAMLKLKPSDFSFFGQNIQVAIDSSPADIGMQTLYLFIDFLGSCVTLECEDGFIDNRALDRVPQCHGRFLFESWA